MPVNAVRAQPTDRGPSAHQADHLAWISWLRVLAITGVVIIHTVARTALAPDARETLRGQIAIFIDIGAIFAVPVFVMISGALLLDPARYQGPGAFLRKRVYRLVPALVFWHLWYAIVVLKLWRGVDLSVHDFVVKTMNGDLYLALYYFWIILGLSLIAPLIIPFIATATRRQTIIAGSIGAAIPALTIATYHLRESPVVLIETAWTWWLPYIGLFILGWALRGVILRGWLLAAVTSATVGIGLLLGWQWHNPDAPALLQTWLPVSYYGASVIVYSCGVFLVAQAMVRTDGPLSVLTRPRLVRIGRRLGDATLGVYVVHLTIILVVLKLTWIGGDPASPRTIVLLGRVVLVWISTYAIVLALRQVPLIRRLL